MGSKKVKMLRIPKRAGLMRARVFGANHATGEVIFFLFSNNINLFLLTKQKQKSMFDILVFIYLFFSMKTLIIDHC